MRQIRVAVVLVLLCCPLAAQNTDIEAQSFLRFSFRNPGARSLGMGGAFLGLADDASAAEANPAGLTILNKPEVALELRHSRTYQSYPTSGEFPNLNFDDFSNSSNAADVEFASVVIPVGQFAFAAYFDRPLNYSSEINTTGSGDLLRFFIDAQGPVATREECVLRPACLEYVLLPFFSDVNVELKTFGLAGAWKRGDLSVGLTARYQEFKQQAFVLRTDTEVEQILSGTGQIGDDDQVTFSVGTKWAPSERFGIGAVYKQGAEFEAPVLFFDDQGVFFLEDVPTFHVPDVAGVGVALRPIPSLTFTADAVFVAYSNLADNVVSTNQGVDPSDYSREDVTELHAGAEYFLPTKLPIAIRAGWWKDPAHGLRYTGPVVSVEQTAARLLLPEGKDETHYSIGAGFSWPSFQIDAAYDTSDGYKVGSLSFVARF